MGYVSNTARSAESGLTRIFCIPCKLTNSIRAVLRSRTQRNVTQNLIILHQLWSEISGITQISQRVFLTSSFSSSLVSSFSVTLMKMTWHFDSQTINTNERLRSKIKINLLQIMTDSSSKQVCHFLGPHRSWYSFVVWRKETDLRLFWVTKFL